ncbi:hypothetical protein [Lacrimispora sphenoides]|uniref:hypothetical protein n=1 Tax=Lacrimispora sphenoides TaxID=29370 RepID=UPI000AD0220C|nr:hypothetical protein [Lacrimispora sphenoides]
MKINSSSVSDTGITQAVISLDEKRIKKEYLLAKDLIEDITEDIDEKDITIDNICKYLNNR